MKRFLLILIAALSLFVSPALSPSARAQDDEPKDYSIRLPGADGKNYDLTNMQGQVLLVSFGATWCQPCKDELKALEELKNEYKNRPVKFFWVSVESSEQVSDGTLKSFARSVKFTFPILRDATRWTYAQFSTRQRIPLVVFFDKQGRFVAPAHAGMQAIDKYKQMVRGILDRLLAEQSGAGARISNSRTAN
ncbi:MAG: TlpA family protein disulfide reductase [Pyrinomonadaceae bacterium]|nr:TlpA family protein disulfide reductase [Pyrinomonadaceae bacterium]